VQTAPERNCDRAMEVISHCIERAVRLSAWHRARMFLEGGEHPGIDARRSALSTHRSLRSPCDAWARGARAPKSSSRDGAALGGAACLNQHDDTAAGICPPSRATALMIQTLPDGRAQPQDIEHEHGSRDVRIRPSDPGRPVRPP
jgi:hypothetical protein